jgi:undecaprenyl-diphosphatase
MLSDLLLGLLQGLTEWLPISSEGVVTAVHSFFFDRSLGESIAFSLWLHLGTALSALIAFRKEVVGVVRDAVSHPRSPSPLLSYLFISTVVSGLVGLPLLIFIGEVSARFGAVAMGAVGIFMLITGCLQLWGNVPGQRSREQLSPWDAIIAGIAQGVAVLPGVSRSGLTVSALLARRVDRREALVLSFLMSIPASLGAGIYSGIADGFFTAEGPLIAAGVACVVGLAVIRVLLSLAVRVNFGVFVIILGAAVIAGAVWQALQ